MSDIYSMLLYGEPYAKLDFARFNIFFWQLQTFLLVDLPDFFQI